jgi:hypothetical protein
MYSNVIPDFLPFLPAVHPGCLDFLAELLILLKKLRGTDTSPHRHISFSRASCLHLPISFSILFLSHLAWYLGR